MPTCPECGHQWERLTLSLTDSDKEEIANLYEDEDYSFSYEALAQLFGTSVSTVRRAIKQYRQKSETERDAGGVTTD